ncbi:amidase [Rhizobium sp. TRM95796]|uniref:amidase n=1 Tax=Rhizobium sp. TRM95796 TaxID=2979862 RepID=UPI0021E7C0F3|nr:amidase [Rhizobium sp. TRM95796]MCV3766775.1 amidase [Rhizobium sp. TRM95796]
MKKAMEISFDRHALDLPALEIAEGVRSGRFKAVDIMVESLRRARIAQKAANCFALLREEQAMAAAVAADAAVARGDVMGALIGVPFAAKDLTPTKGDITTLGSWSSGDWTPDESALVVRRLEAAGAILMGKTTTPEFAFSSFTVSPRFGVTRNPWDLSRTSGGSSGGSAVAVATGVVPFAEGTDMGGSVRIPAAFCGVVGLKPSFGRIPMTILPSQLDDISHFGPLARRTEDAVAFMAAASGPSDEDMSSAPIGFDAAQCQTLDLRGRRFALSYDLGYYRIDAGVRQAIAETVERMRRAGAMIEEVDLGWTRAVNDRWYDLWCVFMAAYFGERLEAWRDRMDPEIVKLIECGLRLGAVDIKRIELLRTEMWRGLATILTGREALLCPTCAIPAPSVERIDDDFVGDDEHHRFTGLDMTCPFNLLPQSPALSVPAGFTPDGLPVGLQIVGHRFQDERVLAIGGAVQALGT